MEDKLRENENKIRSLVTNIPGIAYRCLDRPGWPNVFINDAVEKILGYPAEDFLLPNPKRSIGEFVHPDDIHEITTTNLRQPDGYQLEFRIIDRYKNIKWMLGHGRAIKVENTEDYYLDGFIMDITDRKKMESDLIAEKEKAEQAAATRSAFLANMSHEIRTPMNAIIGFSDILLDDDIKNHQRKQINTINQSAKSLLHILNDVLDSAKLEKGKFQLEYRNFSLIEEVDSVVSTLWLHAKNKDLKVELNIETSAQCHYNGAPDRIRQVLTNLIGNAVKFTERGKIVIDIKEKEAGTLTFSIVDTGIGMTPKQLETIFDAFAQADESMSRRFGGTGLGTTISKQLVELMGGAILAKSEEGKGSEFQFTIPLKKVEASLELHTKEQFIKLPHLNILIVDNIEQNLDLLTVLLKRDNHQVFVARDGAQALLKMENEKLDIVLMDIQMPVMDGLTASIKRREFEFNNSLPKLPIIALTASVLPQDRKSAETAGMNGFANKPIDPRQLMGEIASVLSDNGLEPIIVNTVSIEELKIDLDKSTNLWDSKTALFTEVRRFILKYKSDMTLLESLLKNKQWQLLESNSHKFKGVTGNLALNRLMIMFDNLETASREHNKKTAAELISKIQHEITNIGTCSTIMSTDVNPQASNKAIIKEGDSTPKLFELLLTLEQHVKNNQFDETLLDLMQNLNSIHTNEINTITTACNNFDFELALKHINVLIDLIKLEK